MGLKELKNEIAQDARFKNRSEDTWEKSIRHRAVHVKFEKDIHHAVNCYVRKIPVLRDLIAREGDDDGSVQAKIDRMLDKLACCEKEKELRLAGRIRQPHHTSYYIDISAGDDSNDGLSTGQAWATINKYTTTTVRSPGDIGWLRAGKTWDQTSTSIVMDEDGTIDDWIKLVGCDAGASATDPWGDDDDTLPIFDFGNTSARIYPLNDNYWWFERIATQAFAGLGVGIIYLPSTLTYGLYFKDMTFTDGHYANSSHATWFQACKDVTFDGCTITSMGGYGIYVRDASDILVKNCTINAGATNKTGYAVQVSGGGRVRLQQCTIGGDGNAFSTGYAFYCSYGLIEAVDCDLSGLSPTNLSDECRNEPTAAGGWGYHVDGWNGSGSSASCGYQGEIQKTTTSPRDGGSKTMAKMIPSQYCGLQQPLILGDTLTGFAPIWVGGAGTYTVTVYARTGSAWDSALTAAECYLECSYLDHATNLTRTTVQSTETITNDGAWTAFTCTVAPAAEGFVFCWFKVAEYEDATEYVEVDVEPLLV